ncbi:MAG: (Fe-S)-binding protein [Cycloclasticus sp.]
MTTRINLSDTDLCVKCGLCLPHCPTYTISKNESESPRGRLALIQGWSEGQLELTSTLNEHLDNCLACGSCEAMCPAQVPYTRLLNDFRAETTADSNDNRLGLLENVAINTLTGSDRTMMSQLVNVYQKTGLSKLPIPRNDYLADSINTQRLQAHYPALGSIKRGHVALFTGCASEVFDKKTLHDAIFILQHCGFELSIPSEQGCCGALDLHAGRKTTANELAEQNNAAFSAADYSAVITVASGCGASLARYDNPLAEKIYDIYDFIAPYLAELSFHKLDSSAWLHNPCSLKNTLSKGADIAALLSHIEDLNINKFDDSPSCCGAAGSYMLQQPTIANQLREQLIKPVKQQPTQYLLSSNIGCAMHIRAGLKQAGLNIEVLHPVSLLAQQLKASS